MAKVEQGLVVSGQGSSALDSKCRFLNSSQGATARAGATLKAHAYTANACDCTVHGRGGESTVELTDCVYHKCAVACLTTDPTCKSNLRPPALCQLLRRGWLSSGERSRDGAS